MKRSKVVLEKSFDFAVRIVNLYKYLSNEKKEYVLSKQLLRCGTSIGANINEELIKLLTSIVKASQAKR
jgi:four helix bundle protein